MKKKILIIKTGAPGDVLRTTPILRAFQDSEITWVVKEESKELIENNPFISRIITIENDKEIESLKKENFDRILSLDDDEKLAYLANNIKTKEFVGAFLHNGKVTYKDPSGWFDMGLISKFGKEEADKLKKANTKTYQQYLFEMVGKKFQGEEYILNVKTDNQDEIKWIGIEPRAGKRWPLKKWDKYKELGGHLEKRGYRIWNFSQRPNLKTFISDVDRSSLIITGDTLTMHIALALKKPTVAIFGPTSATEIHGYGRLEKVVSPIPCTVCYKSKCDVKPTCMEQIPLEAVLEKVNKIISSYNTKF